MTVVLAVLLAVSLVGWARCARRAKRIEAKAVAVQQRQLDATERYAQDSHAQAFLQVRR